MQFVLVVLLDAELADMVGAFVVHLLAIFGNLFQVFVVDAAHVAERVGGQFGKRIMTEQARLDFHAREAIRIGGKARHFLVGQPCLDRQAVGAAQFCAQFAKAVAFAGFDLDDFGQRLNGGVEIDDLRRIDFQRVRREVACQHDAVAIENETAIGLNGDDRNAVVLRLGLVILMMKELQPDEAREQNGECESCVETV